MVHQDRHDDNGILRALGLMNGRRIGMHQLVQLCHIILDQAAVKIHLQRPLFHIYGRNYPDISIEHFLVIVVFNLHNLIVQPERKAASAKTVLGNRHLTSSPHINLMLCGI